MLVLKHPKELRPDPNQPRQTLNEAKISEMAENMKIEGVINPIEIDESGMIVTGEQRWRASILAGLESIPCKIINPGEPTERFFRQMSENVHQGVMTDWDIAIGLKKLLDSNFTAKFDRDKKHSNSYHQKGIKELANALGKSDTWASSKLSILGESETVKEAVKKGKISASIIAASKIAPQKYQEKLKTAFIEDKIKSRDSLVKLAKTLQEDPKLIKKIEAGEFAGASTEQVILKTSKPIKKEDGSTLWDAISALENELEKYPPHKLSDGLRPMIGIAIISLLNNLKNYLNGHKGLTEPTDRLLAQNRSDDK